MTNGEPTPHDRLAWLFAYPEDGYLERVASCVAVLARLAPDASRSLRQFYADVRGLSLEALQELFTQTFDLNPVASLEIGWHLYGEAYERGAFLARIREELRRVGVRETTELPDHLTHILSLLGRLDAATGEAMAAEAVVPALEKMVPALEHSGNPFANALTAVHGFLEGRHLVSGARS